jgi:high affinity sulfate transporter 1
VSSVSYPIAWLPRDMAAGLTMAAVVFPQAMAYAALAGLPVEAGLYVSIVPMLLYGLLGTSRALSVSTTSTLAILTAGGLAQLGVAGDAARALSVGAELGAMVGIVLLGAAALRLGFLADFISEPVLAGYKAGTGLVIASTQLSKVLGVPVQEHRFFPAVGAALDHLGQVNEATLLLAIGTVVLLLVVHRYARRVPGPLLVVVLGILAVRVLDLGARGVEVIAPLQAGLPLPAIPDFARARDLLPVALGVALMSFVESSAAARVFVEKDDPEVVPGRELLALGAANLVGALFHGFPAGGGLSQTAVNRAAGARTQLAEAVTAAAVLALLFFFSGLVTGLAEATLGAIVIVAALGLIDVPALRRIYGIRRADFALALVAMFGVLLLGVLQGVLVAVIVSVLVVLQALNHPRVAVLGRKRGTTFFRNHAVHPEDETFPGLVIVRPEAPLYFVNARFVRDRVRAVLAEHEPPAVVALDLSAVPDLDATAFDVVRELDDELRAQGVSLWLAAVNTLPREMLRRTGLDAAFEARHFAQVEDTVAAFQAGRR